MSTMDTSNLSSVTQVDDITFMDLDAPADPVRTPPMKIASPSLNHTTEQLAPIDLANDKLDLDRVRSKAAKKKKKKKASAAAPALKTVYGFQTPVTSGGEESDMSMMNTPLMRPMSNDLASVTSSPSLRPLSETGRISSLHLQLNQLALDSKKERSSSRHLPPHMSRQISHTGSVASERSTNSDRTEMDCYEISLENDFISPDVQSKPLFAPIEGGLRTMSRKMTSNDFEPLKLLGKGTFGTVLLVKQKETGRLYAQKQFRKASLTVHKRLVEQTKTERAILESVNRHPFVVNLYYAFQDQEKLYLILQYAQGGELFHHLSMERMFSEPVAAFYMAEMILALHHLHRNLGVVYRDLKPENCLLDSEGHLLLTDFGLSKVSIDGEQCNSMLGTVEYMAPEVISEDEEYGFAVDWWSLGALGVDLLTGSPPFQGRDEYHTQDKILKSKPVLPYFLSPDAKDLLNRLLRKDPKKRLGGNMPKDLDIMKKHRFFRKIDWVLLEQREVEPPIQPVVTDPELAENFDSEFTARRVSRAWSVDEWSGDKPNNVGSDPFGGFSYVASSSLLESSIFS